MKLLNMVQSRARLEMVAKKNIAFYLQVCVCMIMIISSYTLTQSMNLVFSCLLGCVFVFVLNVIHFRVAFSNGLILKPKKALLQHKKAMFLKFVVNIIIFITIFIYYKNCNYLALFLGYIITQFSGWIILFKV